jgi:hypothetical protein
MEEVSTIGLLHRKAGISLAWGRCVGRDGVQHRWKAVVSGDWSTYDWPHLHR